jgi:hypothetical protein
MAEDSYVLGAMHYNLVTKHDIQGSTSRNSRFDPI